MLRTLVLGLVDRFTSLGVGAALTWLAATLHVVIDPSSQTGLVVLAIAVLTAVYDLASRFLVKRFPWLGSLLGVTPAALRRKLVRVR
jgi:hypothetical protein